MNVFTITQQVVGLGFWMLNGHLLNCTEVNLVAYKDRKNKVITYIWNRIFGGGKDLYAVTQEETM